MKIPTPFDGFSGRSRMNTVRLYIFLAATALGGWLFHGTIRAADDNSEQNVQIQKSGTTGISADWVTSLAISKNTVVAGGWNELTTIQPDQDPERLPFPAGQIQSLCNLKDGRMVAAGYRKLALIGVEDGRAKLLQEKQISRGQITVVLAMSSDTVAAADDAGQIQFLRIDGNQFLEKDANPPITFPEPIQDLALSPDGKQFAVALGDPDRPARAGRAVVIRLDDRKEVAEFKNHRKAVTCVCFAGSEKLLSGSEDGKVILNSLKDDSPAAYSAHNRPVNDITVAGDIVFSVGGGGAKGKNELHVWNWKTGDAVFVDEAHAQRVNAVALNPDGSQAATVSHDGTAAFFKIKGLTSPQLVAASTNEKPNTTRADQPDNKEPAAIIRVGVIGLDTSHATAFTKMLNAENPADDLKGFRVVAAYPHGSPDIESSTSRIPRYTKDVQAMGVEIVDSIDQLLERVDAVLLETNDGRPHLEQLIPCLRAKKRVFVDKPIAASLADTIAIFSASEQLGVPIFSSSSLRFSSGIQSIRSGAAGDVLGCSTWSPCSLEKTHPDLYWYGIHGVEILFTAMKSGCQSVVRVRVPDSELVVGTWQDGRIGTFRGLRSGSKGYGGTAFGTKGIQSVGKYEGYRPLLVEIAKYFRSGKPPIDSAETIEIYAFMEAADESKRRGFQPVEIKTVMQSARAKADKRLLSFGLKATKNTD